MNNATHSKTPLFIERTSSSNTFRETSELETILETGNECLTLKEGSYKYNDVSVGLTFLFLLFTNETYYGGGRGGKFIKLVNMQNNFLKAPRDADYL